MRKHLTTEQKIVLADLVLDWILFEMHWRTEARSTTHDKGEVIYHAPEAIR